MLAGCDSKPPKQAQSPEKPVTPEVPPTPPVPPPQPPPVPEPIREPEPPPIPAPFVPAKILQTGALFNGVKYDVTFETVEGKTATVEREDPESYVVDLKVRVRVPKAHQSLPELSRISPELSTVLPELESLLKTARVSTEFDELYRNKVNSVRNAVNRLDAVLSRHNFFDCETILELQHPKSKRKCLLIQSDMDVDTDGSDGDRVPSIELGGSRTFQPFTSYRWAKKTKQPNPFAVVWEKRIQEAEAKMVTSKDPAATRAEIARLRDEFRSMQTASWLVGVADPFIVLPIPMLGKSARGYGPLIGDYCVIIVGNRLFPAIVGDAGPTTKLGEASLRICREISGEASGSQRALSDLKATYLVFPGSGEKPWGPPDYAKWQARCEKLLAEMGGYEGTLFQWTPWLPPGTVPAPTPGAATPPAGASSPVPSANPATAPVPPSASAPTPKP
jgi:hypothetical protein